MIVKDTLVLANKCLCYDVVYQPCYAIFLHQGSDESRESLAAFTGVGPAIRSSPDGKERRTDRFRRHARGLRRSHSHPARNTGQFTFQTAVASPVSTGTWPEASTRGRFVHEGPGAFCSASAPRCPGRSVGACPPPPLQGESVGADGNASDDQTVVMRGTAADVMVGRGRRVTPYGGPTDDAACAVSMVIVSSREIEGENL